MKLRAATMTAAVAFAALGLAITPAGPAAASCGGVKDWLNYSPNPGDYGALVIEDGQVRFNPEAFGTWSGDYAVYWSGIVGCLGEGPIGDVECVADGVRGIVANAENYAYLDDQGTIVVDYGALIADIVGTTSCLVVT